jgi:hypothetical protein
MHTWILRDFTRQHCRITPFEVRVNLYCFYGDG